LAATCAAYQITPDPGACAEAGVQVDDLRRAWSGEQQSQLGVGRLEQGVDALIVRSEAAPRISMRLACSA
jgi:Cu/Ag efflux pump CusA